MVELLRSGPHPLRHRLGEVRAERIVEGVRALLAYAHGHGEELPVPEREILECVALAVDAARARASLAAQRPVAARCLAALAGVTTNTVRRLARSGVLKRDGQLIAAPSALEWLTGISPVMPKTGHQIAVMPTWWEHHQIRFAMSPQLGAIVAELAPPGSSLRFDVWYQPHVRIPFEARLDIAEAERICDAIRDRFEELDPAHKRPVLGFVSRGSVS